MAKIDISIEAEKLGLALDNLAKDLQAEFEYAISNTAHAAYAQIVAKAQSELDSTRLDYLKGLQFDQVGENEYIIMLSTPEANKLEQGYAPFDLKPGLLGSKKTVAVGSRSGMPWVRTSKTGKKYAAVPFSHRPFSGKGSSDMQQILRKFTTKNTQGRKQRVTQIFKDPAGNPLEGKVAALKNTGHTDLEGLVKYQKNYINQQSGKITTQSLYVTYRMVSEDSQGWQHPGYAGLQAFSEAEAYVQEEIQRILQDFLS